MTHEEKTLTLQLRVSANLELHTDILDTLVGLADIYIARGDTQEGADLLAYVMRQSDVPEDVFLRARDLYEALETWICPRVLMDAQYFAERATLEDIIEYALA